MLTLKCSHAGLYLPMRTTPRAKRSSNVILNCNSCNKSAPTQPARNVTVDHPFAPPAPGPGPRLKQTPSSLFGFLIGLVQALRTWYNWYFANVMATTMEPWEAYMAESKRLMFSLHLPKSSTARVLELGIGTGPNLKYYPPNGPTILGIDPNPEMLQRAASAARALGVKLEAREGSAMSLPYPDASVDACVCTLVLCSVPDPQRVLQEVRRVLRPNSPLIFIEHVRDPRDWTLRGILQRILNPIQKVFNDGCDIRRDTLGALKASGLFIVDWDAVELPRGQGMDSLDWFLISTQIKGAAYK